MSQTLSVIYYAADPLSGRRSHWSLFLSTPSNPITGTIYEAQGGLLQMTYGRVESQTPSKDPTYRGKVDLCELSEDKVSEFEKVAEETILPCSPLKVPKGTVRRDCQDWVGDVVEGLVRGEVVSKEVREKVGTVPRLIMLE